MIDVEIRKQNFIKKAKEIHGDKYDYSQVIYVKNTIKVKIICKIHGSFFQKPSNHLYGNKGKTSKNKCSGNGCPSCSGLERKNTKKFIKEAKAIHGDKYDYSQVDYKNNTTHVLIGCKEHGLVKMAPSNHLIGPGCKYCGKRGLKNNDIFIKQAKAIHGDKYDYSRVEYKSSKTTVLIGCKKHGFFKQKAGVHLRHGCRDCGFDRTSSLKRKTVEDFIKEAKAIHGDKYDYSRVDYKNNRTNVLIGCEIHGYFQQIAGVHLRGAGCSKCGGTMLKTLEEFIKGAIKIHGEKYDYSQVVYINAKTHIKIICKIHGEFTQIPNNHLRGNKCPDCMGKNMNTDKYIIKAKEIHGDKYDYSQVKYTKMYNEIKIICKEHNNLFKQAARSHLNGLNGCNKCKKCSTSKAELGFIEFIQKYLPDIQYHSSEEGQFKIKKKDKGYYKFDGFDSKTNTIFEFDGDFWHGNPEFYEGTDIHPVNKKSYGELYLNTINKMNYCKELGYNYVSIWETEWNNIKNSECLSLNYIIRNFTK